MAQSQRKEARRKSQPESLPFTRTNYRILGAGIAVILAGYYALAQQPWDGILPLDVAPILLVLGYCVIIPVGILYRKKEEAPVSNEELGGQTSS